MSEIVKNIRSMAEKAASAAGRAAGQVVEKSKDALEKASIEKRIKAKQQQLGEAYYRYKALEIGDEKKLDQLVKEIGFLKRALNDSSVTAPPELSVHLCGNCGSEVEEDAMFCNGCGESFT